MASNINKQGVWSSGMIMETSNENVKVWDKVNPNLISMKKSKWYLFGWVGSGNLIQEADNILLVKNGSGWCDLLYDCTSLVGTTFTLSAEIMIDGAHNVSDSAGLMVEADRRTHNTNTGSRYSNSSIIITQTNTWIPFKSTFTNLSSTTPYVGFFLRGKTSDASTNKCWVYLKNIKIETGNGASLWIPNSLDDNTGLMSAAASSAITADNFYEI